MKFDGHDRAAGFLRTAHQSGRLAHAYAFVGPAGIGKRDAALRFAVALIAGDLSENASPGDVLRRRVHNGIHPDVRVYQPEEGKRIFGKPVIAEVLQDLSLRPMEAPVRVAILDRADLMNAEAANTFLKTLEEPPPSTQIVLLVNEWFALLETIRSRVQAVRFNPLPDSMLAERVHGTPGADHIDALQPLAQGSPGLLGNLLADNFPVVREFLMEAVLRSPALDPVEASDRLVDMTKPANDETQEHQRGRLRNALQLVITWWRDALVASQLRAARPFDPAAAALMRRHIDRWSPSKLIDQLDRLTEMANDLSANMNIKMWTTRFLDLAPYPERR
ncbi:MAG: ATP-binding protein [Planctomycetota bacterium]